MVGAVSACAARLFIKALTAARDSKLPRGESAGLGLESVAGIRECFSRFLMLSSHPDCQFLLRTADCTPSLPGSLYLADCQLLSR